MSTASPVPQEAVGPSVRRFLSRLREGTILLSPQGEIIWANPAALAMHGVSAIKDLGGTVTGYAKLFSLSHTTGRPISPARSPLARAAGGKIFSDVEMRVEPRGRDFFRVLCTSGFPYEGLAGEEPSFVLLAEDITEECNATIRFEQAFEANPAPAVICRLKDLRYTRVNKGFLDMSGYGKSGIVGRTVYDVDVLNGASNRDLALERLRDGQTIPQMEALLPLPRGRFKHVIVAGQPIEQGKDHYMLFTFIDLDPVRATESSLRQTEQRFRTAFQLAPAPMALNELESMRFIEVNAAFLDAVGHTLENVIGSTPAELGLWTPGQATRQLHEQLVGGASVRNVEISLHTQDGLTRDVLFSADCVSIGEQTCVLSVFRDITDRRHSETELMTAIEAVMRDASWFSRNILDKLAQIRQLPGQYDTGASLADLTRREREILGLICQGKSNQEMGEALGLSRNTVRNHIATIYNKIGVHTRAAAVIWGRERGMNQERETGKLPPR